MRPKIEIPFHRRQRETAEKANMKRTCWQKMWASRTAWSLVGGAVVWVLSNGVESLANLRKLPSEFQSTYHMFQSWYYDDALWTGTWSSREEGNVEDYKQAEQPLKLSVDAERGKVFGEMFNRSVCELSPMLPPVFVEGEIVRGKLVAYAFAYVGGERNFLYSFAATRSNKEPVITLSPLRDPHGLISPSARLVRRVEVMPSDTATTESDHPDLECAESSVEYIHRMLIELKKTEDSEKNSKESEDL